MPETQRPSRGNRRVGDRRTTPRSAPGGAVWYVLGVLLLLALAQAFFVQMQSGETIPYSAVSYTHLTLPTIYSV